MFGDRVIEIDIFLLLGGGGLAGRTINEKNYGVRYISFYLAVAASQAAQ